MSQEFVENQEVGVSEDFINSLQKFQTFVEANMKIFLDQFKFFHDQVENLINQFPVLAPFSQDVY